MNKRRKAQIFSLLLVFLMVASAIPATFLKPVSATPSVTYNIEGVRVYFNDTLAPENKVFVGYPATIETNVSVEVPSSATANPLVRVSIYYNWSNTGVDWENPANISEVFALNGYALVNLTVGPIPKGVSNLVVALETTPDLQNWTAKNTSIIEVVENPIVYVQTLDLQSSVPYWNGTAWRNDAAFKNVPFNVSFRVSLHGSLANGYPGLVPNASEIRAYLYNGNTKVAEATNITMYPYFPSGGGTVNGIPYSYYVTVNFTTVKSTNTSYLTLVIEDLKHGLTYTIPINGSTTPPISLHALPVHDWWLNVTHTITGAWGNTNVNGVIKRVPFNVTFSVTANSSLGKLGLNTAGTFKLDGVSEATPRSGTFNLTDGVNTSIKIYNVSADPLVVTFSLPGYDVEKTVNITVYNWTINTDVEIYIYDNTAEPYNLTSDDDGYGFYKDIPATMLVKFNYTNTTLGLIDITSNATVEVYYGDDLIWSNNSVPVTNGEGQIFVNLTNVSFVPDDATKKIRVVVKDNNYGKKGKKDIPVYDWGIKVNETKIYIFGNTTWVMPYFIKDIPANMSIIANLSYYKVKTKQLEDSCGCIIGKENTTEIAGFLPFVPKTKLNVTIVGPGVNESFLFNVTSTENFWYNITELLKFNDTGKATITIKDIVYNRTYEYNVSIEPIESWLGNYEIKQLGRDQIHCNTPTTEAFIDHIPANVSYYNITLNFPINEAYINVTFIGPDGATYGPFEYYVNETNGGLSASGGYSYIHLNVSKLMQFNESGLVKVNWTALIFANHSTYNTTISGEDVIPVYGWPKIGASTDNNDFLVGIHQDLTLYVRQYHYTIKIDDTRIPIYHEVHFPLNVNVSVHITGPNYDKWVNKPLSYDDLCNKSLDLSELFGETLKDLQFNETGNVYVDWKVTYWDDAYNITPFSYTGYYKFPVKQWYVNFEVTPGYLEVGKDAFLAFDIGAWSPDSGWRPDDRVREREYNVTIILPNGEKVNETIWGNAMTDFDGYITIPGENITVPGVATIIVEDIKSNGLVKAVQYIPVYPNVQYNKKYIDVKVTPTEIYQYQTANLTIDLQYMGVNGNVIYPLDVDSMANVTIYSGDQIVYTAIVPIRDSNGRATITGITFDAVGPITVEVKDLTDSSIAGVATVEVKPWNVSVTFEPQKVYKYIPVNLSVVATPNVTAISEDDLKVYVNGELYTGEEFEFLPLEDTNFTVAVYYVSDLGNEYLKYNKTYTVNVLNWGIEVETHPLYVHPQFENSLKFPFRYVDENGDLVPFNGTANVTLILPDDQNFTEVFDVVNGEGVIDFGKAVISETGNATLTVVQFIGDYNVTKEVEIPVDDLVTITKVEPTTIYADVPTEIKVYVHSGANDYENITVTLNGKKLKYLGSGVYAENFTLAAGNYTITVYDSIYNVTTTENITVEGWHLIMSATPNNFTAATLRTITITVKAVLDRNESITAKISDVFNGTAVFNNTDLYPIKTNFTVEMEDGVGTTKIQLYAPDAGEYTISGKDEYNKTAEVTIPVSAPDLSKLAWVYVTIKKEGTLESPNETTVIYVAFNNREGPYVPAYDFVNHKSVSGTTEAVFPLAPVEKFSLYVIALPLEIAKDVPYIEDISNFTKTWNVTKTYHEVTPEVTRVDEITWNITVEVDGNVTVYTYTYKPPMAPGVIPIEPQASSVWGNAIYTPVTKEISEVTPLEGFSETIKLTPTLEVERVTPIDIQPAKEGSYFELLAKLYVENAEEQFEQLFSERVVPKVQAMDFLEESEKENLISELKEMAGNVSTANGPLAGKTIEFHIDNEAIAYVEPTNTTTDENGTATFKVYSKAKVGMTPDELLTLMGAVNVWATYDDVTSNTLTVKFGGVGSIAGIVMDENNNPVAGVEVVLYTFNGTEWVPAVDYNGNVLKAVTDVHGRYEIDGIPALPPLSIYRAVALVADTPAGFAEAAVSPFQTSPVNIVITAEGTEATGLGAFLSDAQSHDVKFVTGSNIFNPDYYAKDFLVEYIGAKPVYTDKSINVEALTEKDMIIAIGGPSVNSITAHYQEMAPVKMVTNDDGSISIIVDNETVANWTAPSPWWNVSKGYWVVQRVVDPDTGAVVYMIYGTDADSTWAAAYYFSEHFGELQGKDYVIGYWEDTDGQIFGDALKFASDDNNGFSPTDEIGVIVEG